MIEQRVRAVMGLMSSTHKVLIRVVLVSISKTKQRAIVHR